MAEIVYFLCAVTSALCAILLLRNYRRSRVRLLFWSSACFIGFTLTNVLLFVDYVLVPQMDLSDIRSGITFVSLMFLLFGLIWDTKEL